MRSLARSRVCNPACSRVCKPVCSRVCNPACSRVRSPRAAGAPRAGWPGCRSLSTAARTARSHGRVPRSARAEGQVRDRDSVGTAPGPWASPAPGCAWVLCPKPPKDKVPAAGGARCSAFYFLGFAATSWNNYFYHKLGFKAVVLLSQAVREGHSGHTQGLSPVGTSRPRGLAACLVLSVIDCFLTMEVNSLSRSDGIWGSALRRGG